MIKADSEIGLQRNSLSVPVEDLGLSRRFINILKREGYNIREVADFFRDKITTDELRSIRNISDTRMSELRNRLYRLGLPMLNKSRTNTLIYRFHDPVYRKRITDRQAEMLLLKKWSNPKADNAELSEMYDMSITEIIKTISETEKELKKA